MTERSSFSVKGVAYIIICRDISDGARLKGRKGLWKLVRVDRCAGKLTAHSASMNASSFQEDSLDRGNERR